MGKTLLLIGIGGALGSISRYLASFYLTKLFPSPFPYGTFLVNVIGCFLIGLIFGCWEKFQWASPETRLFLSTGFCGGFTTFSAFAWENVRFLQNGQFNLFLLYTGVSIVFGLAAVAMGWSVCKLA